MKVSFKIQTPESPQFYDLEINSYCCIGRGQTNQCKINDLKVSTKHCQIEFNQNGIEICDLGSKNGTFVNGIKIKKTSLYIGDEIKIGESQLSIDPTRMDEASIKLLVFKGGSREESLANQLEIETKEDLETAYKTFNKSSPNKTTKKLTINQIRQQNKKALFFAQVLNILTLLILTAIPIFILKVIGIQNKMKVLLFIELGLITFYYIINFKIMKFSIGEKLAGIEKKFKEQ